MVYYVLAFLLGVIGGASALIVLALIYGLHEEKTPHRTHNRM